jgi:RNA polymerase sigma-70 factor (ECF subfamily)
VSKAIQNRVVHDEELIVRLQRGDEWAFQLLIRRFRQKVFYSAFGITLDAEQSRDIVQDVFFQVYRRILDFRGDASLSTWLHRITVGCCLNWRRRWTRRFQWFNKPIKPIQKKDANDPDTDSTSTEKPVVNQKTRQLIDQALKTLSDQARTVFVLREMEDLSYEEIAYITGTKVGTVRSQLFNARQQLKAFLEPVEEEESQK